MDAERVSQIDVLLDRVAAEHQVFLPLAVESGSWRLPAARQRVKPSAGTTFIWVNGRGGPISATARAGAEEDLLRLRPATTLR